MTHQTIRPGNGAKIQVVGGVGFNDAAAVHAALARLDARNPVYLVILENPSQGAQLAALDWCRANGVAWAPCQADQAWSFYAPDGAVAWPDAELEPAQLDAQAAPVKVWHPIPSTMKAFA